MTVFDFAVQFGADLMSCDVDPVEEKPLFDSAADGRVGGRCEFQFHRVRQILTNYSAAVNKKNAQIVKFVHFSGVC